MGTRVTPEVAAILTERFGKDTLLSVATLDGGRPSVRIVDGYYDDGSFYAITHALSGKMRQIQADPRVAVCGEWFTAHGVGENIGHPRDEKNAAIAAKLHEAFAAWYDNGHTNEDDPDTCILRIRLTDGILFSHGTRYDIDFTEARAILTQALDSEVPSRSTWFAQTRAAVVERGTYASGEFEDLRGDDKPRAAMFDETDR